MHGFVRSGKYELEVAGPPRKSAIRPSPKRAAAAVFGTTDTVNVIQLVRFMFVGIVLCCIYFCLRVGRREVRTALRLERAGWKVHAAPVKLAVGCAPHAHLRW